MQQQFFHMNIPRQEQGYTNMTPQLQNNLIVFEICNNWESVKALIRRIKIEEVKEIDVLQNEWLNYINNHRIDIETYENEDDFINKHLQPLVETEV